MKFKNTRNKEKIQKAPKEKKKMGDIKELRNRMHRSQCLHGKREWNNVLKSLSEEEKKNSKEIISDLEF